MRLSGILMPGVPLSTTLSVAQKAFREVVQLGSALPPPAANAISFCGNDSATNFDEIDIDCVIKLTAPADSNWTRDAASTSGIFHIRQTGHEALMPAPCSANADELLVLAPRSADAASALAVGAAISGERPDLSASSIADNVVIDSPIDNRPGVMHYVIGETYGPLSRCEPGATTAIQKLLKLERILCLIQAKEGKETANDICSCVLGVVLIGPSMDSTTCAAIFATLSHYQSSLQRLWTISEAKRLFAIRLQPLRAQLLQSLDEMVAGVVRVEAKGDATRQEVAATREEVAATRAKLTGLIANVEAKAQAASTMLSELAATMAAKEATTNTKLAELAATRKADAAGTSKALAARAAQMEANEAASRAEVAATCTKVAELSTKFEAEAAANRIEAAATRRELAALSAQMGALLALYAAGGKPPPPRREGGGVSHL